MPNYALIDWIKRNKDTKSEAEIKADLLKKGWKKPEVLTALDVVYRDGNPNKKKSKGKKWCCIVNVIVALLVVAAIVVAAVYISRFAREQAAELVRQAERNKIVGGSEVWREDVKTQTYDIVGRYTYKNEGPGTITKVEATVALAQTIAGRQEVISEEVTPAGYEITTDDLGNRYAKYLIEKEVKPGENYEFKLKYRIKTNVFKNHLGACEGEQINDFLGAEQYLEVDNEEIKKKAAEITAGKANDCEKAEAIYNHVGDHIEYVKNEKDERGGALEVHEKGQGDCTYFADYYTALARAAGIPTRYIEGAVYTKTKDEENTAKTNLHDWAESYLPGTGWTPIDPTWGEKEYSRDNHFSQADGKHIVLTYGRNKEALDNKYFINTKYWYQKSQGVPKTSLDDKWTVDLVE
ncbi:MAG: transglutaminase domain-containing protein [Parcubacteria group bacterium]|nr:transglutaminase domain-containing protein [Parcubacteria group bacterium]